MDYKFRNHPTLILEQLGVMGVLVAAICLSSLDDVFAILRDIKNADSRTVLIVFLVIFGIVLLRLAYSAIIWYKTWITVDKTSITITKNTLFRSVNTIGMRNISNINIERNLLERILGTSKVKIDTESRSTADSTDVTILLRKEKAEALKETLLAGATAAKQTASQAAAAQDVTASTSVPNNGQTQNGTIPNSGQSQNGTSVPNSGQTQDGASVPNNSQVLSEVAYNTKQVLTHCVYTASVFSILICLAALIAIVIFFFTTFVFGKHDIASLIGLIPAALGGIITIGSIVYAALYSLVGDFFRYYGFRIKRLPDHLHMEFGLFKRTSYEIPIKRISSIVIERSLISRITKRCLVNLINIGMGDEKEENTRLLLSIPEKHLPELLHRLLPEFDSYFTESDSAPICPPKSIWWKHVIGAVKFSVVMGIAAIVPFVFLHLTSLPYILIYLGICLVILAIYFIGCYCTYSANKLQIRDKYVAVTNGMFASSTQFVDYHKIQYMELSQNLVERILHLEHGMVYILAGALNNFIAIPSLSQEQIAPIVQFFLEDSCKRRKKQKG